MNRELLVKMVNEIGTFFVADSPAAQVPQDIASHLRRFWEPRMRAQLVAHWQAGGEGLSDPAREAAALIANDAAAGAARGTPAR